MEKDQERERKTKVEKIYNRRMEDGKRAEQGRTQKERVVMEAVPAKTDGNLPVQHEFTSMLERLATDPNCDVGKLEKMMDLQERVLNRDAEQAFNADMVLCQRGISVVRKNRDNEHTKSTYADLTAILVSAKPIYTENGFALTFYEGVTDKAGHVRVMVDILHRQGHSKTRFKDYPLDDKGIGGKTNKTQIHANQSTFMYGRRNLTCLVFNIPTGDDDDGNASGETQCINEKQQHTITDLLLAAYDTDQSLIDGFFDYIGCRSVEEIPAKDFNEHKNALQAIAKKRQR